jgi:ferredoxin
MEIVTFLAVLFPVVSVLVLILPVRGTRKFSHVSPASRYHEADAVLSRRLLTPGTRSYESYYREHPGLKEKDDLSRQSPGLLSPAARNYHPATFAASRANFHIINHLGYLTHENPVNKAVTGTDPGKNSRFITRWLKSTGAHDVGFTSLKEYHLYSHKGRGPLAGTPVNNNHPHAIAMTVEMDHAMMQPAPAGTAVMESSEQYLRSGILALKLAAFIRELGYEATAHIDGNYEVICPLVAVDAGLGTIGRMGLLITPRLGPRVRISVVTTSLPVKYSTGRPDPTILHFCHLCKKCARNCPVSAIPRGSRVKFDGIPRWRINSEKCYHFWTVTGTDCGRCITVCPYSHPDNLFHRLVRRGIKNNLVFRYLAVKLDDVFYGWEPRVRPLPAWVDMMDKP